MPRADITLYGDSRVFSRDMRSPVFPCPVKTRKRRQSTETSGSAYVGPGPEWNPTKNITKSSYT